MIKRSYSPLLHCAFIIALLGCVNINSEIAHDIQENQSGMEHEHQLSNDEILQIIAELKQELAALYPLIKDSPEAFTEFKRLTAKIVVLGRYLETETEEQA